MKWALILWAAPLSFLTGWYALSYNDMNFGYFMLSRAAHDLVFQIYGNALGLPPADIPPLVAKALAFDSLIVFSIPLFKRRKKIFAYLKARYFKKDETVAMAHNQTVAIAHSEESLSSAP